MGEIDLHDVTNPTLPDSPERILTAVCGSDHMSYLIADQSLAQRHVQYHQFHQRFPVFHAPLGYLTNVCLSDELLYEDFTDVRIAVRGIPFAIATEEQLSVDSPGQLLARQTQVPREATVDTTPVGKSSYSVICAWPENFLRELYLFYKDAEICHVITPQIEMALRHDTTEVCVWLCLSPEWVEVVIVRENMLLFANHFRWVAPEDIVYFVTAVLREFELAEEILQWKIYGAALNEEFREHLISGLGVDLRPDDTVEMTSGPIVELLSLAQCAL